MWNAAERAKRSDGWRAGYYDMRTWVLMQSRAKGPGGVRSPQWRQEGRRSVLDYIDGGWWFLEYVMGES